MKQNKIDTLVKLVKYVNQVVKKKLIKSGKTSESNITGENKTVKKGNLNNLILYYTACGRHRMCWHEQIVTLVQFFS